MKRERRTLTRREWGMVTSHKPVVRRVAPPDPDAATVAMYVEMNDKTDSPGPNASGPQGRDPRLSPNNTSQTLDTFQGGQWNQDRGRVTKPRGGLVGHIS